MDFGENPAKRFVLEEISLRRSKGVRFGHNRIIVDSDDSVIKWNRGTQQRPDWVFLTAVNPQTESGNRVVRNIDVTLDGQVVRAGDFLRYSGDGVTLNVVNVEPYLSRPDGDDYVLTSTRRGVRKWSAPVSHPTITPVNSSTTSVIQSIEVDSRGHINSIVLGAVNDNADFGRTFMLMGG